jgi:hypothetical protein
MRERGYVEGQNLAFVLRYAPGDPAALRAMLPAHVLVRHAGSAEVWMAVMSSTICSQRSVST